MKKTVRLLVCPSPGSLNYHSPVSPAFATEEVAGIPYPGMAVSADNTAKLGFAPGAELLVRRAGEEKPVVLATLVLEDFCGWRWRYGKRPPSVALESLRLDPAAPGWRTGDQVVVIGQEAGTEEDEEPPAAAAGEA